MTTGSRAKKPYGKWYWGDWRADPALKLCSLAARGLWMDLLCIMAEAEGYLRVNGEPVADDDIPGLVGARPECVMAALAELERRGIAKRTHGGVLFSKRMVKDEIKSRKNRDNGEMGGNPTLCNHEGNQPSLIPYIVSQSPESIKEESESYPESQLSDAVAPNDKRGSRLSAGWKPDSDDRRWAAQQGLDEPSINRNADNFRDHWLAKPGKAGVMLDWHAAWRTWVRKDVEWAAERKAKFNSYGKAGTHPDSRAAQMAAGRAKFLAENPDQPETVR